MSAEPAQPRFDQARAEAFAGQLLTVLNHGALSLMVSIGHRTGLYDAMRKLPPATSEEIATRAGLNERYVREWLGAMVTSRVVEVDPTTLTLKPDGVYLMQDISGTTHVHQDIEHPEQLVRGDEVGGARSSTSTRS